MGCLYKLVAPNGKAYIGISLKGLDARWAKHVEHACGKRTSGALYSALRKYGPQSFIRTVLDESDDWDTLCQLERDAIQSHRTLSPNGYNITTGGEGTPGVRDEAARARISAAQKKRFTNPEQRAKMAEYSRLSKDSPKYRASCLARRRPRREPMSQEEKSLRIRAALARPDVKSKMAARAVDRARSAEWRARVSAAKTGKKLGPCSDARKALIASARRREWSDPILRSKRLAALAVARAAKARKDSKREGAWNWLPLNPPPKR